MGEYSYNVSMQWMCVEQVHKCIPWSCQYSACLDKMNDTTKQFFLYSMWFNEIVYEDVQD